MGLLSLRILVQGRQDMFPAAPACMGYGPVDVVLSEIKQASLLGNEKYKRVKELSNAFFLFVPLKHFPGSKEIQEQGNCNRVFPTHNLFTHFLLIRHLLCFCLLFATVTTLVQASLNIVCVIFSG